MGGLEWDPATTRYIADRAICLPPPDIPGELVVTWTPGYNVQCPPNMGHHSYLCRRVKRNFTADETFQVTVKVKQGEVVVYEKTYYLAVKMVGGPSRIWIDQKAGENLLDRIHVFAISLSIGKGERRPEYESLLWQIDETYPDPDADIGFPLLFKHQDREAFIMLFANARLAFLRRAAIIYMDTDDSISETKVYKSQVIKMLDDPNKKVRTQAIRYLSFNVKDPNAPKPKFKGTDTVDNEQEVIQYWKGKGGITTQILNPKLAMK